MFRLDGLMMQLSKAFIKRSMAYYTVQTSYMQYACRVQFMGRFWSTVYGEVIEYSLWEGFVYLDFSSVFSEPFINDEILLYKRLW